MPQLNEPSSIQDFGNKLTTLYYRNQKKGFKFIGDDPENKVIPIPMDAIEAMLTKYNLTGNENDKLLVLTSKSFIYTIVAYSSLKASG